MAEETVGYIGAVSADLGQVRAQLEKTENRLEAAKEVLGNRIDRLQAEINGLQMDRMRLLELEVANVKNTASATDKAVEKLAGAQTWLIRTVASAIIVGIIAAALSLFRPSEVRYVPAPTGQGARVP